MVADLSLRARRSARSSDKWDGTWPIKSAAAAMVLTREITRDHRSVGACGDGKRPPEAGDIHCHAAPSDRKAIHAKKASVPRRENDVASSWRSLRATAVPIAKSTLPCTKQRQNERMHRQPVNVTSVICASLLDGSQKSAGYGGSN